MLIGYGILAVPTLLSTFQTTKPGLPVVPFFPRLRVPITTLSPPKLERTS